MGPKGLNAKEALSKALLKPSLCLVFKKASPEQIPAKQGYVSY